MRRWMVMELDDDEVILGCSALSCFVNSSANEGARVGPPLNTMHSSNSACCSSLPNAFTI